MYQQFSVHTPTKNKHVALGGYFFRQEDPGSLNLSTVFGREAPSRTNFFYTNYAYRVWLGPGRLSMGISAGMTAVKVSYEDLPLPQGRTQDNSFNSDEARRLPNFGAGLLYYTTGVEQSFFVGLSVPYFMSFETDTSGNVSTSSSLNQITADYSKYNFILTGGFKKRLSDQFTINPSALMMYKIEDKKLKYETSMNIGLVNEMLWLGVIYKSAFNIPKPLEPDPDVINDIPSTKVLSFNFNINIPKTNLLLGYSLDYYLNSLSNYFNFSHELILRYELRTKVPANIPFYY